MNYHNPVLLQATSNLLAVVSGHRYVDATLGGGGHTAAILSLGGKVLGLDQDADAITACSTFYKTDIESGNLCIVRSNFIHLKSVVQSNNWQPVSGVLLDLGISSHQIDTPDRGFSFRFTGPLDMRMDDQISVTAADIVNTWPENAIADILTRFGELPNSRGLAKTIMFHRPYQTTTDLAQITKESSQQVFQALRIAVNDELGSLTTALDQAIEILSPLGRVVVITFHSLEDRIVKQTFNDWEEKSLGQVLTKHPLIADAAEISVNSRSKSAKLRAFEKK